jgi:hypothetical protein
LTFTEATGLIAVAAVRESAFASTMITACWAYGRSFTGFGFESADKNSLRVPGSAACIIPIDSRHFAMVAIGVTISISTMAVAAVALATGSSQSEPDCFA